MFKDDTLPKKKKIGVQLGLNIRPYISNLLIKKRARQNGYGTALVKKCEEYIQQIATEFLRAKTTDSIRKNDYIYHSLFLSEESTEFTPDLTESLTESLSKEKDTATPEDERNEKAKNKISIYLHAEADYTPARKLYQRLKYSEVGKGVKFGSGVIKFRKDFEIS